MKRQLLLILLTAGLVFSGEYHVDKDNKNMVKFISDAPIEDFEGVTDQIDGYVYWENSEYTKNSEIYMEVDLNSLDTGIGLRNRHMRENYLETDQHPITYFKGKIVNDQVTSDTTVSVNVDGEIFIHGITQPLSLVAELIKKESGYRIRANFIVKLSDFKIDIPSIMFYKIDENMDLHLDFFVKEMND